MRSGLLLLALVAAVSAVPKITPAVANTEFLEKQQHVYYLLKDPLQAIPHKELETIGKTYEIEKYIDNYTDKAAIKWLIDVGKLEYYNAKTLPFTIARPEFRKLFLDILRALESAREYKDFLYLSAWIRTHMPAEYFVPAYILAVILRKDMKGIMVPSLWDIFPNYFVDSEYIQEAQNLRSMGYTMTNNTVVIPMKYQFLHHLDYWYKDPGRNTFYYYFILAGLTDERVFEESQHDDTDFVKIANRRGVQVLKNIKYFYARESLELISHGYPPFNFHETHVYKPFKSNLRYINGLEMPGLTPDFYEGSVKSLDCESRLVDAIDSGFLFSNEGKLIPIYTGVEGFGIFGNAVEGFGRSLNLGYYRNCLLPFDAIYSDFYKSHDVAFPQPSVFENPATMGRYKDWIMGTFGRIVKLVTRMENRRRPVNQYDLFFKGVEVKSFDISKLETFMEKYELNLTPATYKNVHNVTDKTVIKTFIPRLNYKPFTYNIIVNSDVVVDRVVVKIFAKRADRFYGKTENFCKNRWEIMLMDQFFVNLKQGENVIERSSADATMRGVDTMPQEEILRQIKLAMDSHGTFHTTNKVETVSFPDRFTLPRGTVDGLKMDWLVIVMKPGMKNYTYGPVPPYKLDPFYKYNNYDSIAHDVVTGKDFHTGYLGDKFIHHGTRYQRDVADSTVGTGFWDKYYEKFHLTNIAGGVISIDGDEADAPFNRRCAEGALSVPNIKVVEAPIFYEAKEEFHGKYGTTTGHKYTGEHVVY